MPLLSFDMSRDGQTIFVMCRSDSGIDWGLSAGTRLYVLSEATRWNFQSFASVSNFCYNNPTVSYSISFNGKTLVMSSLGLDGNRKCTRSTQLFERNSAGEYIQEHIHKEPFTKYPLVVLSGNGRTFVQYVSHSANTSFVAYRFSQASNAWVGDLPVVITSHHRYGESI